MSNLLVPYKFQAVTEREYKLTLVYEFDSKIFDFLFDKSKEEIRKKRGIDINCRPDVMQEFNLPEDKKGVFKPVLWRACKQNFYNVKKQVSADGIKLLSGEVDDATFKRLQDDKYNVTIIVKGDYINEHN